MNKEKLPYSDWYHVVKKQSQYAPIQVEDDDQSYLTCPRCGWAHKDIPDAETITCRCGLHMQRWGNALIIWLLSAIIEDTPRTPPAPF